MPIVIVLVLVNLQVLSASLPRLVLEEVAATPLPTDFAVVGADGVDPGLLALWGPGSRNVAVVRAGDVRELSIGEGAAVEALRVLGTDSLEFVQGSLLVRMDIATGARHSRPIVGRDTLASVRYKGDHWYEAQVLEDGSVGVRRFSWNDTHVLAVAGTRGRPWKAGYVGSVQSEWSRLVQVTDFQANELLVTQAGAPYLVARVSVPRGDGKGGAELWRSDGVAPGEGSWVAMASVVLGEFLLQQLVDLRSDRRKFVLYSRSGGLVRELEREMPLTILGRLRGQDEYVVAVRATDRSEIVVYRASVLVEPQDRPLSDD